MHSFMRSAKVFLPCWLSVLWLATSLAEGVDTAAAVQTESRAVPKQNLAAHKSRRPSQTYFWPSACPEAADPEAIERAREALRQKIAELERQPLSTRSSPVRVVPGPAAPEAIERAREQMRQRIAELEAQPRGEIVLVPAETKPPRKAARAPKPTIEKAPAKVERRAERERKLAEKQRAKAEAAAKAAERRQARIEAKERARAEAQARKQAKAMATAPKQVRAEPKQRPVIKPPREVERAATAQAGKKAAAIDLAAAEAKTRAEVIKPAQAEAKPELVKQAEPRESVVKPPEPQARTVLRPVVEPVPLPISAEKQRRLAELLTKYKADLITPEEYHRERARILAEP